VLLATNSWSQWSNLWDRAAVEFPCTWGIA